MSPAKVNLSKSNVLFVPDGQYIGYVKEFENLSPKLKALLTDDGYMDIFGTRKGFSLSGDITHGSWRIEVSKRGVKFKPSSIKEQATGGGAGFTVKESPPLYY